MSHDVYDVIIVGAGPAGLSAAAHAHVCGMSYLLLEQRRLANTLDYYYPRGKFVMTLPALIPLRSDMPFAAGSREEVLRIWKTRALESQLRHSHESVQKITKQPPEDLFAVETAQHVYTATHVVLAIGKKGNPRRLGVPGEELPHVADRLEDAGAYTGASILVVGGGDAAAETALALSERNHVTLSYRKEEFRPDKMNETLRGRLQEKIARGEIQAVFNSEVQRIDPETVVLKDPQGTRRVRAEHVFLMLGASVPTHFLQRCGVTFSSDPSLDKQAVPRVDEQYQAVGVEGLYLIGSLLSARLRLIPGGSVEAQLATIRSQVPLWRDTPLPQLRELLLLSTVRYVHPGARLFDKGHYSTTFFTIVEGSVDIEVAPGQTVQRGVGEFFGEMSLLSDVPRSASVTAAEDSIVIETPRHALVKLMDAVPAVKHAVEQQWIPRALHMYLSPQLSAHAFLSLAATVTVQTFTKGEVIVREGEPGEAMYIICGGVIKLSTLDAAGKELSIAYRSVGTFIGEMALFGAMPTRSATATAMNRTTVLCLTKRDFLAFVQAYPGLYGRLQQEITKRVLETAVIREVPRSVELLSHFLKHGVVESTDVLLIDETKCIRCNNCVLACAATHEGQTRLDRSRGPSFAQVHVPVACRHCVGAPCLLDCPPGDAIARDDNGVVRIDPAKCIGCGNCATYCPYGVIFMVPPPAPEPKFWERLGFRLRRAQGKDQPAAAVEAPRVVAEPQPPAQSTCAVCAAYAYEQAAVHEDKAIKCDLCADRPGGPACVESCPTGAAIRVSAEALSGVDVRAH